VQGVQTLSEVVLHAELKYVPAVHGNEEQGVHAVAPLVLENVEPIEQDVHTLFEVFVHTELKYVPAVHGPEQGVHVKAPYEEKVEPSTQSRHSLSPAALQP
jgi:hypothetical protein